MTPKRSNPVLVSLGASGQTYVDLKLGRFSAKWRAFLYQLE